MEETRGNLGETFIETMDKSRERRANAHMAIMEKDAITGGRHSLPVAVVSCGAMIRTVEPLLTKTVANDSACSVAIANDAAVRRIHDTGMATELALGSYSTTIAPEMW
jgi:hypothetical protein